MHATDTVINLITDSEKLISLVIHPIGDGPHNVVLPANRFDHVPAAGEQVTWSGGGLRLNGIEIELRSAQSWNPKPDWSQIQDQNQRILPATPLVTRTLQAETPDNGVLHLLNKGAAPARLVEDHFVEALIDPADRLIVGLHKAELELALAGVHDLAGLGTGLTPSGDDFITGAMMACWAGFCKKTTLHSLPRIADHAAQHTTRLSAAYLRSAAQGQFGIIWHTLLDALIGQDEQEYARAIKSIARIGHNSGVYTLTGFLRLVEVSLNGT